MEVQIKERNSHEYLLNATYVGDIRWSVRRIDCGRDVGIPPVFLCYQTVHLMHRDRDLEDARASRVKR